CMPQPQRNPNIPAEQSALIILFKSSFMTSQDILFKKWKQGMQSFNNRFLINKSVLIGILCLYLLAFACSAQAQPQISYMIPDIGAPGMNTYIELIAPYNKTGSFGSNDSLYLNASIPGDPVQ